MSNDIASNGVALLVALWRKGFALSAAVAGLIQPTTFGAAIAGLGDRRWAVAFIAVVAVAAVLHVWIRRPEIRKISRIGPKRSLAPPADGVDRFRSSHERRRRDRRSRELRRCAVRHSLPGLIGASDLRRLIACAPSA